MGVERKALNVILQEYSAEQIEELICRGVEQISESC
jgi:hypothetical protein